MTPADDRVATFLDLVEGRRLDDAGRLAMRQVESGDRPQDVIRTLLAAAQAEVGARWHRAAWTVAHEHQATAVVDAALHGVVSAVQPRRHRGTLAVVCAEGDWHTLPSRMAAELLRLDGWEVMFLGGSLPAPDLSPWLQEARPDAVVVTCSLPTFGRGVLNIAAAGARIGIPVVAGGRGLGADASRAAALGAGWAGDLTVLATALAAPTPSVDPDARTARLAAGDQLLLRRADIVGAAMWELGLSWPPMHTLTTRQLSRTAEDFGRILDVVAAATLMDDTGVFTEFVEWLTVLLTARGIAPEVVPLSLRALTVAMPPELEKAHAVLAAGTDGTVRWEIP
ncbi:MAG TPA: cobalamin-dependent protein [Catenuloplanes sp.]|jgi:methanogenic corrinoid protein MtbC1